MRFLLLSFLSILFVFCKSLNSNINRDSNYEKYYKKLNTFTKKYNKIIKNNSRYTKAEKIEINNAINEVLKKAANLYNSTYKNKQAIENLVKELEENKKTDEKKIENILLSMMSEFTKNYKAILILLKKGGAFVNSKGYYWNTPLHNVNDPKIAKILLDNNVNIKNINKDTPLLAAIKNINEELANFYIDNKANINIINRNDNALSLAIKNNLSFKLIKKLIQKGADIKIRDLEGNNLINTILKKFNNKGFKKLIEIIKILISKNQINLNEKDDHDQTPLY